MFLLLLNSLISKMISILKGNGLPLEEIDSILQLLLETQKKMFSWME